LTTITNHFKAPILALNIKDNVESIDNIKDYIFAIQLNYRENHTIYHLKNISEINFEENFIEIRHKNGSCNYYDYKDISEYHIINADDLSDLWGNEI
jgi:hypothetical protein